MPPRPAVWEPALARAVVLFWGIFVGFQKNHIPHEEDMFQVEKADECQKPNGPAAEKKNWSNVEERWQPIQKDWSRSLDSLLRIVFIFRRKLQQDAYRGSNALIINWLSKNCFQLVLSFFGIFQKLAQKNEFIKSENE